MKRKSIDTTPFTVRLSKKMIAELDKLAKQGDRSRSWLVSEAVANYIELKQWQIEKIEAGLRDAKAGRFASSKEMQRILNKYAT